MSESLVPSPPQPLPRRAPASETARPAPPPLLLEGVGRSFGTKVVFSGVDLALPAGGMVGIIGDNGAGKTTLLRVAAGILAPSAGRVRVFGVDPAEDRVSVLSRIGALIEGPGHYDELTVADNLTYWYSFYPARPEETGPAVEGALDRFGLREVADQAVGTLSTGYRRRLSVARAAHPWSRLALLDEPFANLDPRARGDLKGRLRELVAEGLTVLFSSHILADVDELCDQIHVLVAGRLHAFDGFSQIRRIVGDVDGADLDRVYARLADHLEGRGRGGAGR